MKGEMPGIKIEKSSDVYMVRNDLNHDRITKGETTMTFKSLTNISVIKKRLDVLIY